jgi:hypothetical protein
MIYGLLADLLISRSSGEGEVVQEDDAERTARRTPPPFRRPWEGLRGRYLPLPLPDPGWFTPGGTIYQRTIPRVPR